MRLEDHIIHIDGDTLVIDKPAGLAIDPPRAGGDSIAARIDELALGFKRPPTAMHRLDRDTSGCLLFARNPRARAELQAAFEGRAVQKIYLAVVGGIVSGESGEIDLPLSKVSSAEAGWRMTGDPRGQKAVTRWRRVAVRDDRSLIEFRPTTGRTHQIRVHAREGLGHGIIGDKVYGFPGGEMLLHASRLVVPRGAKPTIDVTAPLPIRFGDWLDDG